MDVPNLPRQYPLQVHIATVFLSLIMLLGVTLSLFHYRKSSEIIVASSERVFEGVAQELLAEFQATYAPVSAMLEVLAQGDIMTADGAEQRLGQLPLLKAAVQMPGDLATLQVGYANGDYFIVRPVKDEQVRATFDAPSDSALVVDNISDGLLTRQFYDADGEQLAIDALGRTDYDPRTREWYQRALAAEGIATVDPYYYFFLQKVGITVGRRGPGRSSVIAADIALDSLSASLASQPLLPGAALALLDEQGRVLAYSDPGIRLHEMRDGDVRLAQLEDLPGDLWPKLSDRYSLTEQQRLVDADGETWRVTYLPVPLLEGVTLHLLVALPESALLADAISMRNQSLLIMLALLLVALPVAWWLAQRIAQPLRALAQQSLAIQAFDFSDTRPMRSFVTEINALSKSMTLMKHTLGQYNSLITSLAGERDFDQMLRKITEATGRISGARVTGIYLYHSEDQRLHPACIEVRDKVGPHYVGSLLSIDPEDPDNPLAQTFRANRKTNFQHKFDAGNGVLNEITRAMESERSYGLILPLCDRRETPIGVLFLAFEGQPKRVEARAWEGFVAALSGFAAVSMESRQLIKSQKDLMAAFIRLIAGAIDAKSPYTGGHCQRVPRLTKMLAKALEESEAAPFSEFALEEDDWEALHLAAWLHDCGKVTTPEYVVDKATKLETIYDRIHEVRTRFEVLKRDAMIDYWQTVARKGYNEALQQTLDENLKALDDDFAFVAECNLGSEQLSDEALARLEALGKRTWWRTLDDSLGISRAERDRRGKPREVLLPVKEPLLADRPEHIVPLDQAPSQGPLAPGNPWGFTMRPLAYKYNRGELHNLRVRQGTLSPEERLEINNHIVQTIIMLESLPYPEHLKQVPEIAGGHHERMDGQGYPRGLTREQMPVSARAMAIADIFEALTAADRPYKPAKTLSEALGLMADMCADGHIDPDIFRVFLEAGVYRAYAREFLLPTQIDTVNIADYLPV